MLLPKDENDERSVIVEIRGGAGGDEAALFAHKLFRMYTMYAQSKGWSFDVINANETEIGGMKEVSFSIDGDGAFSRFNLKAACIACSACPKPKRKGVRDYGNGGCDAGGQRVLSWILTPPTLKRYIPFLRAGGISTKPRRLSAQPIFPQVWWWNAKTSAASLKIKTCTESFAQPSFGTKTRRTRQQNCRRAQKPSGNGRSL